MYVYVHACVMASVNALVLHPRGDVVVSDLVYVVDVGIAGHDVNVLVGLRCTRSMRSKERVNDEERSKEIEMRRVDRDAQVTIRYVAASLHSHGAAFYVSRQTQLVLTYSLWLVCSHLKDLSSPVHP